MLPLGGLRVVIVFIYCIIFSLCDTKNIYPIKNGMVNGYRSKFQFNTKTLPIKLLVKHVKQTQKCKALAVAPPSLGSAFGENAFLWEVEGEGPSMAKCFTFHLAKRSNFVQALRLPNKTLFHSRRRGKNYHFGRTKHEVEVGYNTRSAEEKPRNQTHNTPRKLWRH